MVHRKKFRNVKNGKAMVCMIRRDNEEKCAELVVLASMR